MDYYCVLEAISLEEFNSLNNQFGSAGAFNSTIKMMLDKEATQLLTLMIFRSSITADKKGGLLKVIKKLEKEIEDPKKKKHLIINQTSLDIKKKEYEAIPDGPVSRYFNINPGLYSLGDVIEGSINGLPKGIVPM